MQCRICETEVSERALFCEVCGNRVRQPAAQPAPPRTAARVNSAPGVSAPPRAVAGPPIATREELAAAVAARAELGDRMEPEVLDTFLARIESAVVRRVDEQVDARLRGISRPRTGGGPVATVPVAVCSLIFGIPLSAVAGEEAGFAGLLVCWAGIAAVNFAVNMREKLRW